MLELVHSDDDNVNEAGLDDGKVKPGKLDENIFIKKDRERLRRLQEEGKDAMDEETKFGLVQTAGTPRSTIFRHKRQGSKCTTPCDSPARRSTLASMEHKIMEQVQRE